MRIKQAPLILHERRVNIKLVERVLMWVVLVSAPTQDMTRSYDTVFRESGHLEYRISGGNLKPSTPFEWEKKVGLRKLYLIWSGAKKVEVNGTEIRAQKIYTITEQKTEIMAAISEVSSVFKKEGMYTIKGIDMKEAPFQGYAVIEVVEEAKAPLREIVVKAGMARLKPGELYTVEMLEKGEKGKKGMISRFSVIGGNGKAGNGSSNLLNGVTVSGKDDWDGSSGIRWDIDDYDVKEFKILSEKGVRWSMDPLLQWLYPIGAVVQIDLEERR